MNVVVYVGNVVRGQTLGVAHYATNLVNALAVRPDTGLTLLGEREALATYRDLPNVRLVDEASVDSERLSLLRNNELLIQVHQFQRRPVEIPTVVVVHDLHVYDVGWKYAAGRSRAVRLLHKNVIRARAVVSEFPHTIRRIVTLEPAATDKSFLTVSPSLIEDFSLDDEAIQAARHRYGFDDGRPTILYPAQLQLHKNHWNLLTAVHELERLGCDVRLICTGSAAAPKHWACTLKQRVEYLGLNDVHFPGYVPGTELRSLYQLSTAVVSTSLAEGGAYLAQEAVAHDTAAACSAIPSALAHLERMQLRVPTFDPFDVGEIVNSLEQVIDDPDRIVAGYGPTKETVAAWTWSRLADEVISSAERVRT